MSTQPTIEQMSPELQLLTSYLLYERENQTDLRIAFAALVQERHHHFHDLGEDKESKFEECRNDVCIKALTILQMAKKPRIELNEFSAKLVAPYNLRVERTPRTVVAYLQEKSRVEAPEPATGVTILEA